MAEHDSSSGPKTLKSSAAVPAAVSGASRPRFGEVKIRNRGRLPHWEKDSGLYFITFRLADSLPQAVLRRIEAEVAEGARKQQSSRQTGKASRMDAKAVRLRRIEAYLDSGAGACYLREGRIAAVVADALWFGEGKDYRLLAWCVMPNHVHVVARLLPGRQLARILHAWKFLPPSRRTVCCVGLAPFGSGNIMTAWSETAENSIVA